MAQVFATTGRAPKFGDVHVDVITNITSTRSHVRTEVALEEGAAVSLHRQAVPVPIVVSVMASDVSPYAIPLLWEREHASKVRDRMTELAAGGEPFKFFDGGKFWRTPNGSRVWVIDSIAETESPDMSGVWRAQVTLGELARFSTAFTSLDPNVAGELQDSVDGVVDVGDQAPEAVPDGIAEAVAF